MSSSSSSVAAGVDASPLMAGDSGRRAAARGRRPSLRGAARLLRLAGNRRVIREPSMLVREAAAGHLEERQSDWAYSRPVVTLDVLWNFAFVAVAAGVLLSSRKEAPSMPLQLWIAGYALQCVLHVIFVCVQYRRRCFSATADPEGSASGGNRRNAEDEGDYGATVQDQIEEKTSFVKRLESAITMFSFMWWIIGFYWISDGEQSLTHEAPQLYWLCVIFLAFDVFFVVFCVALACFIGIAVCCCLPCIIAILYAVADQQEGASNEDIHQLTKYKFRRIIDSQKNDSELQKTFGGIMTECATDQPIEHRLSAEDAECCICLSAYDDGAELRELPCLHHFHCTCIDRWLYINATCPLCKFSILKNSGQPEEV